MNNVKPCTHIWGFKCEANTEITAQWQRRISAETDGRAIGFFPDWVKCCQVMRASQVWFVIVCQTVSCFSRRREQQWLESHGHSHLGSHQARLAHSGHLYLRSVGVIKKYRHHTYRDKAWWAAASVGRWTAREVSLPALSACSCVDLLRVLCALSVPLSVHMSFPEMDLQIRAASAVKRVL